MIDQNRDGFVDKEDLHDMLASLGNYWWNHYSISYSISFDLFSLI
jgi:Ca2+-binding EF-hand superfamily protein